MPGSDPKTMVDAVYELPLATKENEGSYLCRATNDAGTAEDMVQIIVMEDGSAAPGGGGGPPPPQGPGQRPDYRPDYNR